MACGDVLSLEDLQTAKKHQIFEAEVITGKVGGVAGGATIDTATNPVTGQTQQTLPSILADLGFDVQSWTSSTGGVLASANQVFLNAVENGPEVGRRIFRPPGLKEGAGVNRCILLETDRQGGPSKGELLAPAHRTHPEVLDAPTDLRHELNHPQAGPDDLDRVEV